MVVAGQAAHWFDYGKVWPELSRTVRRGGTLAFWGYKDNVFVEHPAASKVLDRYCYGEGTMGPYWEQPGRGILRDLYRVVVPPEGEWEAAGEKWRDVEVENEWGSVILLARRK